MSSQIVQLTCFKQKCSALFFPQILSLEFYPPVLLLVLKKQVSVFGLIFNLPLASTPAEKHFERAAHCLILSPYKGSHTELGRLAQPPASSSSILEPKAQDCPHDSWISPAGRLNNLSGLSVPVLGCLHRKGVLHHIQEARPVLQCLPVQDLHFDSYTADCVYFSDRVGKNQATTSKPKEVSRTST